MSPQTLECHQRSFFTISQATAAGPTLKIVSFVVLSLTVFPQNAQSLIFYFFSTQLSLTIFRIP